jgi:hypothetical protein
MAIRYAVANGNWSNTATWDGGTLPTASDDVFANNFTVTIDGTFTVLTIRNTANTTPSITAGGFFTFANGGNLTCTASNGVISGGATVITYSLNSPNLAYLNSNIGTPPDTNGLNIINVTGTGTLNVTGILTNTGNRSQSIIRIGNSCILNIIGEIISGAGFAVINPTTVIIVQFVNSVININGNIVGATNNAVPILCSSLVTLNITGNITGTTSGDAITTPASGCVIDIVGNLTNRTITFSNNTDLTINGNVIASSSSPCITSTSNTANVKIFGNLVNINGNMAFYGQKLFISTTMPQFWQFTTTDLLTTKTLYTAGVSIGNPDEDDVREGVDYGPSLELTGTLVVPTPDNVRKGVPTDDTVGTADLTAEDILDAISISTNDVAVRLRNVSTVASTGAQIASYNV